ncbi:globin-like protein [Lasiosphaeria miniovina]|uniref:nitric oxide dioxygenase n=1 Tax=Lasiosphaeria miniovina TaxID=1954250 RepID=A0AA40ACT0_9PEZI|nr:globin-like protein [Lasiosphaeria miniovina]KAK0713338.1 globin-like protein [Lasiosphaeria miniovina]
MAAALTESQVAIVKSTAPVLKEHGNTITSVFYKSLIADHAALSDVFNASSQVNGRQPRALASAVLAYATYVDDLPKLAHAVERIAHKHVSLQVTPAQYDIVGQYLIQAIGQVLGSAATPDIVDAWTAAYGVLAGVFINREADMYRANAADRFAGWRNFRILRKVAETPSVTSFSLAPVDGELLPLPRYLPGQYVSVQVPVPALGHLQSRQYSLSRAPREQGDYYRISVKREEGLEAGIAGLVSNLLHASFGPGDEVELSHPQGEFFVDPQAASKEGVPAVLISASSGATPLMAILDSLVLAPRKALPPVKRPVSWVHAARSSAEILFADEVTQIARDNDNVTATFYSRRPAHAAVMDATKPAEGGVVRYLAGDARLDLAQLDRDADLFLADARADYFICGPETFMVDMRRALVALGVDKPRIFLELFSTGDVADE